MDENDVDMDLGTEFLTGADTMLDGGNEQHIVDAFGEADDWTM